VPPDLILGTAGLRECQEIVWMLKGILDLRARRRRKEETGGGKKRQEK
jgi:hypothetical protein